MPLATWPDMADTLLFSATYHGPLAFQWTDQSTNEPAPEAPKDSDHDQD